MAVKACSNCKALLSTDAIFCQDCGSYQGQPGVDEGAAQAAVAMTAQGMEAGLRLCPHCGMRVSGLLRACTNCFKPLEPIAPLSGPELKPASRGLVWFFMVGAGVLVVGYIVLEVVLALTVGRPR